MDLCTPEIIGGWSQFREFYGLRGNHFVYFDYVGNNSFKITLFKGRSSSSTVNKFYDCIESLCPLIDGPYHHFTITLSGSIKPSGNFLLHHFLSFILLYNILLLYLYTYYLAFRIFLFLFPISFGKAY